MFFQSQIANGCFLFVQLPSRKTFHLKGILVRLRHLTGGEPAAGETDCNIRLRTARFLARSDLNHSLTGRYPTLSKS